MLKKEVVCSPLSQERIVVKLEVMAPMRFVLRMAIYLIIK